MRGSLPNWERIEVIAKLPQGDVYSDGDAPQSVIPVQAEIHNNALKRLDSRLRWNDAQAQVP
jgi:hypothetical protein